MSGMSMRNTAILGIALLAAALAGCGKKEQAPETNMAPANQAPATAPAAPQESTPAPMEQHPSTDGSTTAPAPTEGTTPPAADGNKAPELAKARRPDRRYAGSVVLDGRASRGYRDS